MDHDSVLFRSLRYRLVTASHLTRGSKSRRSVGQSVLVSSTHLGSKTRFISLSDNCGFLDVGRPLWQENHLSFTSAAGLHQRSHSPYFTEIRDSSNLESQAPIFISPMKRVTQLQPQALGSFFVASYDSQGCDGNIRTLPSCAQYIYYSRWTQQKTPLPTLPLLLYSYVAAETSFHMFNGRCVAASGFSC
jgi:hypothetical protein